MSGPKWHQAPMTALDTETTGIDALEDRIVTAAVVHTMPGTRPRTISWTIDPGVEVPEEAAGVHGWTTKRLRDHIGRPDHAIRTLNGHSTLIRRDVAIFEIANQVASAVTRESALVVHNAAYDLTLLEAECVRNEVDPISIRPHGLAGVVDPMVIEKQYDPYRKNCYRAPGCRPEDKHHECGGCRGGKHKCGGCGVTDKTLTSLCTHYGVRHAGAHDCADDAVATVRLLHKLVAAWPQIGNWKLGTLHEHQVTWRRDQANGLRAYFDKNGIDHDGVDPGWPVQVRAVSTARETSPAGAAS